MDDIKTERKGRLITLLCAFALPVVLGAAAFASVGIYPFGEKTLLIADMSSEYIDYLSKLHTSVRGSGSILRSWNMGMGLNMLGLIAFYIASPFNIIVVLMPLSMITEAVFIITVLKLGVCGLLFAMFACSRFPEVPIAFQVALGAAYALCSYNIAYSSNIMWLDGSAFLPLVLLGVEKVIRGQKCKTLILSLAYVFLTSYYIGYMVGIFSFLYFTARYFSENRDIRGYVSKLARFLGSAVLAAGCCAFLLLPAFLNLKSGQNQMWTLPRNPWLNYPFTRLASKLVPGAYDSLTDNALPHIYCTVAAVCLMALYFRVKAIPTREKLVYGCFAGFMLASFSSGLLDLAWHAFEEPTWYPARYSFTFSFLMLYFSLRCASVIGEIRKKEVLSSLFIALLLFIEVWINRLWFLKTNQYAAVFVLIGLYALIILSWNKKQHLAAVLIVLLVCMESFFNASLVIKSMDRQFGYKSRTDYRDFTERYMAAASRLASIDGGIYRTEIAQSRNANGALPFGLLGISHYSTTTDQSLNGFLRALGYNIGTINELRFSSSTPLTNGMLGIKYVLSENPMGLGYTFLEDVEGVGIYRNESAWPLAFWSPESALKFTPGYEGNPFELQNEWIAALSGESMTAFAQPLNMTQSLDNMERIYCDSHLRYDRQARGRAGRVGFELENPAGSETFAFFPVHNNRFSSADVEVQDKIWGKDLGYRSNTIISLGNDKKQALSITSLSPSLYLSGVYFSSLDLGVSESAAKSAAGRAFEFTSFSDTEIEGKIKVPSGSILATTFPYDEGWTIFADGKKVNKGRLAGVFLAVSVPEGEHMVRMRYSPEGFKAGVIISLCTTVGILLRYSKGKQVRLR